MDTEERLAARRRLPTLIGLAAIAVLSACSDDPIGPEPTPAQLLLQTPAAGAEGGLPFGTQPTVVLADASGRRVPDATDAVELTVSSGGSIVGVSTIAAVDGIARFADAGVDGPAATYVLTYSATLGGVTRVVTQSLIVASGTPTKYVVTPSAATAEVGSTVTITAQLSDANNAPVLRAGRTVTWAASGAPGSLGSSTSTTNSLGVATVSFTLDTVFSQSAANISATDGPFNGSTGLAVTTAAAAKLAFQTPPSSIGWRVTMRPAVRVTVQDRYGNTVVSSTATVALAIATNPGGAELTGGESRSAVDGVAEFASVALDQPGVGYTLRSSSGSLTSATSPAFDVSAVATLATSPDPLLGLAVVGSSVYYTTQSGPVSDGHVWKVPAMGGNGVVVHATMFNDPSGRVISDGGAAYVLALVGINTRNGAILVFPESGPVRQLGLGDTARSKFAGADFEFDGTYFFTVYWPRNPFGGVTNRTGIVRVRLSDGSATSLLDREWPAHRAAIAVAGGQLFYTDSTASGLTIERKSIDGGTATTLVTGVGAVDNDSWRSMLVAGNSIYWSDRGSAGIASGIKSAPLTGGGPTVRVPGVVPSRMQTDGTYLFVVDNGSIRRYRLSDFTVTTIVENDSVGDIALDDHAVYWVSNGVTRTVKKAPK
jgi:hypothetical protein